MALTDVHFQEGDGMDFVVELPAGTLGTPTDILLESNGTMLLLEAPLIQNGGGGNIFIMSE
jgi:hypothetical protein